MKDHEIRHCFLDGIDWQYHLDGDNQGTTLYPSVSSVKENKECIKKGGGCGIVEVEVRFVRWVEEQDLSKESA